MPFLAACSVAFARHTLRNFLPRALVQARGLCQPAMDKQAHDAPALHRLSVLCGHFDLHGEGMRRSGIMVLNDSLMGC